MLKDFQIYLSFGLIILTIISPIVVFIFMRKRMRFMSRISRMSKGIPHIDNKEAFLEAISVSAVILEIKQTGVWLGRNPQIDVKLKIPLQEGGFYEASTKTVIPVIDAYKYQPGNVLPITVDKNDKYRIMITK